jgi:hypothetical protein
MTEEPRPDDLTNIPSGPPAYAQPGGYEQPPNEQPPYQQPAYAPPPAYQQPTYQQPTYQPPTYQQPTGYQQPGFGQQPGYGQQPQQPGWNQQPGYQQPGYPQQQPAWGQQPTYWNAGAATDYGYNTSILAIIAGVVLLLWGLLWTFGGIALIAVSNATGLITDNLGQNLADSIHNIIVVVGAVVLIIGLLQLRSALGVWLHKSWARILGILFGILGTLFGLAAVAGAAQNRNLSGISSNASGNSMAGALVVLVSYALILVILIIAGGHFRRDRPA